MRTLAVILCSFALLAACSRVRVVPLNPGTDERTCDAQEGIRYFLPKPSLLVTEGLATAQGTRRPEALARSADQRKRSTDAEDLSKDAEQLAAEATTPPADSTTPHGDSTRTPSPGPSTPAPGKPNTILGPTGPTNYTITVRDLPNYSQPMTMYVPWALGGSATFTPTLHDGWMLTSINATSDTNTSETLTALAAMGTARGGTARQVAAMGPSQDGERPQRTPTLREPGLYAFIDDQGQFEGLTRVAEFPLKEIAVPPKDKKDKDKGKYDSYALSTFQPDQVHANRSCRTFVNGFRFSTMRAW